MRAQLEAIGAALNFDEKRHAYSFDGMPLDATTTIIKALDAGKSDRLMGWAVKLTKQGQNYREVSKGEMAIGTALHRVFENWSRRRLGMPELPQAWPSPEAQMVAAGLSGWLDASGLVPILPEVRVYHPEWRVAGQLDLFALWHEVKVVVDAKSCKEADTTFPEWPLQVSAYRGMLAYHGIKDTQGLILRIPKDGSEPSFLPLGEDDRDLEAFLALLKVYRWVNRKNEPKSRVIAAAEKFMAAKA